MYLLLLLSTLFYEWLSFNKPKAYESVGAD